MKNTIIQFSLPFLAINVFSQKLPVEWETKPKNGEIKELRQIDSNTFFVKKIIDPDKLRKFEFQNLELKKDPVSTSTNVLPYSSMDIYNHYYRFEEVNNQPYWYNFDKEDNVFLSKLDENFVETENKIYLGKLNSKSPLKGSDYCINNGKAFFYVLLYGGKKGGEIYVRITDTTSNKIFLEKTIPFPENYDCMDVICSEITSANEFLFLLRPAILKNVNGSENVPLKGESHKLFFIKVTEQETIQSITEVPENIFINDGRLFSSNSQELIQLTGLDTKTENRFVFSLKWDNLTNKAVLLSSYDVSKEVSLFQDPLFFTNEYNFREIVMDDGNFLFIMQKYHYYTNIYEEDIIVYEVNQSGEIEWAKGIPHKMISENSNFGRNVGSYFAFLDSENSLKIILNESEDWYDESGNFIPDVKYKVGGLHKNRVSAIITLNPDTQIVQRKRIEELGKDEILYPSYFFEIAPEEYLIYKCSEETESFGILKTN